MKTKNLFKSTLIIISVLVCIFALQLVSDAVNYSHGMENIKSSNYAQAEKFFSAADGYKDSEILCEYANIMKKYDKNDFSSVYQCYHSLSELQDVLHNNTLIAEITRDTTEISTIYDNYNQFLYLYK